MQRMQWPEATKLSTNLTQVLKSSTRCIAFRSYGRNWRISKNIPATDPHFLRVQFNLNMYFGGRNENHDYKEKFQEILWDPNIAMSNW